MTFVSIRCMCVSLLLLAAACGEGSAHPEEPKDEPDAGAPCFGDLTIRYDTEKACVCGDTACADEPACSTWPPEGPCHVDLMGERSRFFSSSGKAVYWFEEVDPEKQLSDLMRMDVKTGKVRRLAEGLLRPFGFVVDEQAGTVAWESLAEGGSFQVVFAELGEERLGPMNTMDLSNGFASEYSVLRDHLLYSPVVKTDSSPATEGLLRMDFAKTPPELEFISLGIRNEQDDAPSLFIEGDAAYMASASGTLTTFDLSSMVRTTLTIDRPFDVLYGVYGGALIGRSGKPFDADAGYLARISLSSGKVQKFADLVLSAEARNGQLYWTREPSKDAPTPLYHLDLNAGPSERLLAYLPHFFQPTLLPVEGGLFWEAANELEDGDRLHFLPQSE